MVKKISIGVGVVIIFFAVMLLKPSAKESALTNKESQTPSQTPSLGVEGLTDTDQDGLKDWEEVLWKTDPNNPDTDGDGITDYEEAKIAQRKQERVTTRPATEPQKEPATPVQVPIVAPKEDPVPPKIISPLKIYGNNLGVHISTQSNKNQTELDTWNAFFAEPSDTNTQKIKDISLSYKKLAENLETLLSIPDSAANLNKALALSYGNLSFSIDAITETKGTGNSYELYSEAVKKSTNALIDIIRFFQNNNVKFTPQEPGSIFMINI